MASLSSIGIGSGLDVNSLLKQLMAAERAPGQTRLDKATDSTKSQISAFGALKSALSGLEGALKKFDGADALPGRKAQVQADAGFTATAGTHAVPGKHQIIVHQLASAHVLHSSPVVRAKDGPATQLGHGTLQIQVGEGKAVDVVIEPGKGSLAEIRDAINRAGGGAFSATVVRGDGGDVLTLTSGKTGASNSLSIRSSGGDGGLVALATDGGGMRTHAEARDAIVEVDGIRRSHAENRMEDVVDGVTLTLTKADAETSFSLDVTRDNSTLKASTLGLISAYNTAMTQLRTQSAAGGEGKVAGPLSGDSAPRGIISSLRNTVAAAYGQLSALGLKSSVDGSLSLDGAKFDAALDANPEAVQAMFGNDGAIGSALRANLKSWTGADGMITTRSSGLSTRMKQLDRQRTDLDARMQRMEDSYRRQFIALDAAMTKLSGTSQFIAQQFFSPKSQ